MCFPKHNHLTLEGIIINFSICIFVYPSSLNGLSPKKLEMKKWLLFVCLCVAENNLFAQIFIAKSCEIIFFSESPVENITATNKSVYPILNIQTGNFQLKINMRLFKFEKPLMEEHFNENYVESDKYPHAVFKGKINEIIDYSKNGKYDVTVTGILSLHGVNKKRTIPGKLVIKDSQIVIYSDFIITLADHNIIISGLHKGIIPHETHVKINATLDPFKN